MRELDWTRRGPLPPPAERRIPDRSTFGRNMDTASDAGSERGGRRNFESDGKVRDFGNWERKGPLSPPSGPAREGGRPRSNDGPGSGFRRNSPAWGEGRSQDGSRPPRPERAERTPTAADMDNQWRARMRPDQAPKEPSNPPSPVAPASRPKLNLAKRTVPEAAANPAPGAGDSKASPFGAARPIDTATREREVEEKRQLALRQKKDTDEKPKPEKAEKQKQPKEAKDAKEPKEPKQPGTDSNKDSVDTPQGGKNFDILRQAGGEDGGMTADHEPEEAAAAPAAAAAGEEQKETANGNWRAAETSNDDAGWSTVGTKQRNNRRGQTGRGFA